MQSYLKNKLNTYSSGMLKKLSLLVAFVGDPKLVLLDEPFITLDTDAVSALDQIIANCYQNGVSFLISSHQALQLELPFHTLTIHQKNIEQEKHAVAS